MSHRPRNVWPLVKYVLFVTVLAAVTYQGWQLVGQVDLQEISVQPGWLVLAVLVYIASWLPAAWYWRNLLQGVGHPVSWPQTLRAYYCGHLGKYVPGKAAVLVMRAALLEPTGTPPMTAGITAGYESLACMAASAAMGTALLPTILPREALARGMRAVPILAQAPWAIPVLVLAGCLCGLPLLSRGMNRLLKKTLASETAGERPTLEMQPSLPGFVFLMGGWWLQGLSLGLTIHAVSSSPWVWSAWPSWTAGAALATFLGFVVLFAPGGMGVREGVLMEILRTQIDPPRAVLVAVLLRIVFLTGEIGAAAVLYTLVRKPRPPQP
jgi:hypothetical protein